MPGARPGAFEVTGAPRKICTAFSKPRAPDDKLCDGRPTGGAVTGNLLSSLAQPATTKLVLIVLDGLGGLPLVPGGPTELEAASTPNFDQLAREGVTGVHHPMDRGITPGSGPAHLALFGYDPVADSIGRGALSAVGLGIELGDHDLAVRLNFCTLDDNGNVTDRRAGRISTELNQELIAKLNGIRAPGIRAELATERRHRAVLVLRGEGLDARVQETDPQATGVPPLSPDALHPAAEHTSRLLTGFVRQVGESIGNEQPANFVLMRGYGQYQALPSLESRHQLRAACLAVYPMYRGVARAMGMTVLPVTEEPGNQIAELEKAWDAFDLFFVHIKDTDTLGEDGDFDGKVRAIEAVDRWLPRVRALKPDVLVVTGDHSTPAKLRAHSWHPVPVVLLGALNRPDSVKKFSEPACFHGGLGHIPARSILPLMLAHGQRLAKYGA